MSAVRRIGTWITRHWVTTVCIVLLCAATAAGLVTAAGGYSVDDNPANAVFATGQHQVIELGRWWTISTWTLMGSSIEELLFAVALVLLAGWLVEHRVRRAPWVFGSLVALVIGALLAILLESAGIDADFPGAYEAAQKLVSDPSSLGATLAAVGSAWCPRVMRRRIRSSLAMLTTMLVVYVGHPSDLQRLLAVLVGILIGSALVREPLVHDLWRPSRSHELRAWLASMLAVLGVGPIIASVAMRANAVAVPLVSLFMSDAQFDADACNVWHVSEACASLSAHSGFTMFLDNVITGLPWLVLVLAAWGVWRGQRIPLWIGATIVGALGLTVWYFWLIEPLVLGDLDLTTASLWGQQGQWFWQVLIIGLVHLVVAGVLIANQRLCQNQPDVRLVRKSLRGVGLGLLALAALYLGVAWSFPVTFTPTPDPWQAVLHLPERFLPQNLVALSPSSLQPVDELSSLLCVAIPILTTLIMLVAIWRIMTAPEHHREEPSFEDRANALKQGSVSTLSAMTQWPGMHSWLDRDTGTLVPFRLEGGVAIILAAPLATSASTGAQSTAEAGEHALLDRLLEELSKRMEPLYGFRSLLSFKRKFKPEYRPLYLAYPDAVELPAIGFGLTNAYLPELTLSQSWQAVRMIRSSERERARREAERRREQQAAAKRERAAAAAAEQAAVAETAPAEARNAAADQGESAQAAHPERKSQGS